MSDTHPDSAKRRSRKDATPAATVPPESGERIAKVMARAGLCSRRDAEAWIQAGRVAVNGKVLTSPALNIGPDDVITVDGQPVTARERTRLFLYHKPRGLVTTARDPEGRPTVFEALPDDLPRVVSVGRLDINTEGLLLLTNDGGLARVMELPATGWLRRYRVRANGFITQEKLDALRDGITIEGVDYAGIEAALDRTQGANQWLTMGLREGKNREIKRVLEHLGLVVNRLIRLSFGPFQLGDLAEGTVEEVRTRVLKDQLGAALAAEAGVMWEDAVAAEIVTRHVAADQKGGERPARRDREDARAAPARERTPRASGARPDADRAERPRQDRPAPKSRPHVSALRGDASPKSGTDTPRKRITRATTEDRKGRAVQVERVTVKSKERHKDGEGGTSRNARNFARTRREAEFGADAAAPRGRTGGERSGGFSSERPLTGRALKDGKVRSAPGRTGNGDRPARGRAAAFGSDAAAPRPRTGATRGRDGERSGGFSSERPLTGRALKDGKVRRAPGHTGEDGRPSRGRAAGDGPAKGRGAAGPRSAGPRPGGAAPRSGNRPQGGDKPRGGGGGRPPRSRG